MDDKLIAEKIQRAMDETAAPADLVERTVVRAQAITAGRAAERQLAGLGSRAIGIENLDMGARSVIGRLMMTAKPPEGSTVDTMVEGLVRDERFKNISQVPANTLLTELKSGKFLQRFGVAAAPRTETEMKGPAADIEIPEKGGLEIKSL